jgi:hypothetical protein
MEPEEKGSRRRGGGESKGPGLMLARYCSYLGGKREGSEAVVVGIRKIPCEVPVCLKVWVWGVSMAITDAVPIVTLAPPVNFFDARWETDEATCAESERRDLGEVCL